MTKRLFIKTYGCQMNVYDSARMADVLAPLGYAPGDDAEGADLVILNTCHIREKASEKVYSELGRLRLMKQERPGTLIAVAGCTAQAEGAEILRRMPFVDVVVGPQAYHRLPELVARASRAGRAALDPPPLDQLCTELYGGPAEARIMGTVAGETVDAHLSRVNGCEIQRWQALAALLPAYQHV